LPWICLTATIPRDFPRGQRGGVGCRQVGERDAGMICELEAHRGELEELCRRFGVRRLEIFGSGAVGGSLDEVGDLDFLVEFERPTVPGYADRYFGLLEALETLFGCPVDLVVTSAIRNPYFRAAIERTKALVYAG